MKKLERLGSKTCDKSLQIMIPNRSITTLDPFTMSMLRAGLNASYYGKLAARRSDGAVSGRHPSGLILKPSQL